LIHQGQYGLDIKAKVLPVYEKIFDIEFPLPKLDTLVVSANHRAFVPFTSQIMTGT
jgi:aminopeptidase N